MTAPIASSDGEREAADPLTNFREGQWWVKELDQFARSDAATDDQKRAVAVVHHLLRAALSSDREMAPEAKAEDSVNQTGAPRQEPEADAYVDVCGGLASSAHIAQRSGT